MAGHPAFSGESQNTIEGVTSQGQSTYPGFVNTRWVKGGMDDATYAAFKKHIDDITPLGRMTEAEEVAETALFLLTTSAPITGELLGIDGGVHLTVNAPDFNH